MAKMIQVTAADAAKSLVYVNADMITVIVPAGASNDHCVVRFDKENTIGLAVPAGIMANLISKK